MDLSELLQILWRRKLVVALTVVAVVGLAYATLSLVKKQYEATSTVAVTPRDLNNGLVLFGTLDAIVPVYADAAGARSTRDRARQRLGQPLADINVVTFHGTGIIKIKGRSHSPLLARDSAQEVTNVLLNRAAQGDVGIRSLKLTELDTPAIPTVAVFPKRRLTLLVAVLLGLALGIAGALLRENLATKVETAEDLERVAGIPVFAEIPDERALSKMSLPSDLATDARLRVASEAFRDLRTNLLFSEGEVRSIVVTSPEGSHGKTTVAFGLAVTVARAGAKTLLLDGDLRRGRIADLMSIPRSPGLSEVLRGMRLDAAIQETTLATLHVMTAGKPESNPAELLTSEFLSVLNTLEREYETIIVDGTPVVPISDTRIMARFADATILVASARVATKRQIRSALARLSLIGIQPTAVILNNSRDQITSDYYILHEDAKPREERVRRSRTERAQRSAAAAEAPRRSPRDD
jgi:receptor protein-tyrosine kinase